MPINKTCSTCGGENILVDAYVEWNKTKQEYVIQNIFDYAYCVDCDGETTICEVEIEHNQENDRNEVPTQN